MAKINTHKFYTFYQVTELILRLENDRVVTERRLEQEKIKLAGLNEKIAAMTQRRLVQLPIAVQKGLFQFAVLF